MVMTNLRPAHAAEKALGVVRVDPALQAIGFLVVDLVHCELTMQFVPCPRFVRIDRCASSDPGTDEVQRRDFRSERTRQRLAVTLADNDQDFALAGLILP